MGGGVTIYFYFCFHMFYKFYFYYLYFITIFYIYYPYLISYNIEVVPGRAGGGSFKRKKNYIAKKKFNYRMYAKKPTITMSNFFF